MNAATARLAGLTQAQAQNLSKRDREYLEAWENLPPETLKEMKAMGIDGPDLGQRGPVNHSTDDSETDPFATIAAPESDRYFDEPEETEKTAETRALAAEAVLRTLYILTGSRHPKLRLKADCLLAIINRADESSQAAIARKHGLTRAAVSKQLRDMRAGSFLDGLECFFFGGKSDVSEKARTRALRVHAEQREQKTQCKPTPKINSFLQAL